MAVRIKNPIPSVRHLEGLRKFGIRPSLERIRRALAATGRPDRRYSVALITGTNGKGTCAKALAEILGAHGVRAGLYLSPHVDSYRERYEVGGRRIARGAFEREVAEQRLLLEDLRIRLTEFEFLTLLAYRWFARERVSWAVVEVGMGGRWDATNAADPEVSILTSVGIDHVEFLGRTPEQIACDKAHIARLNRPLFVGPVTTGVRRMVERVARRIGAAPHFLDAGAVGARAREMTFHRRWRLPCPAAIYGTDVALAIEAARYILRSRFSAGRAQAGIRRSRLPGRCQTRRCGGRSWILDVAHNESAFDALFGYLRARYPKDRLCVLLGMQRHKRGEEALLSHLRPGDRVELVRLKRVASKPIGLWRPFIRRAREQGVITSPPAPMESVLRRTRALSGSRTIVTGSFQTVREALAAGS